MAQVRRGNQNQGEVAKIRSVFFVLAEIEIGRGATVEEDLQFVEGEQSAVGLIDFWVEYFFDFE